MIGWPPPGFHVWTLLEYHPGQSDSDVYTSIDTSNRKSLDLAILQTRLDMRHRRRPGLEAANYSVATMSSNLHLSGLQSVDRFVGPPSG